jgi:hypothetical protein
VRSRAWLAVHAAMKMFGGETMAAINTALQLSRAGATEMGI